MMEHVPSVPDQWDVEADVVVVGFGAAGVAASVTAHDLGAEVVILEKAPEGQEGGNTRVAGQGYLNTSSAEKAAAYLTALCGPYTVPAPMVQVWAEEMCRNNQWLESLGGDPQEHQHPPVGIEFPDLPGADCVHKFHDGPTYGYSYTSGSPYNDGDGISMAMSVGADLWHMNNYAGPSMALKVPEIRTTFSLQALHYSKEQPGGMIVVGPDA